MITVCQLLESEWWLMSPIFTEKNIFTWKMPKNNNNLTLHFTTRILVKYENEWTISHRGKHTPNPAKWSVPYLLVTRHIPPMQLTTTIMIYDWNIVGSGECLTSLALIQNISIIKYIYYKRDLIISGVYVVLGKCQSLYTSVYDVPRHCHTLCHKTLAVFAN